MKKKKLKQANTSAHFSSVLVMIGEGSPEVIRYKGNDKKFYYYTYIYCGIAKGHYNHSNSVWFTCRCLLWNLTKIRCDLRPQHLLNEKTLESQARNTERDYIT